MEFSTKSPEETKELGKEIADTLIKQSAEDRDRALVIALSGDLGSGKTVFVQGVAEYFGISKRITSPTFILMRSYSIENNSFFRRLYHLDLYRLDENIEQELRNLGIEEIWQDTNNVVLIEWADKIKNFLPENTANIDLKQVGGNERSVIIN